MGKAEEQFHSIVESLITGRPVVGAFPTRFERQQEIENTITRFRPDLIEAAEILAAIQKSLENRYGEERITDISHAYAEYRQALEEADGMPE